MSSDRSARVRCERCARPEAHCLCHLIPALDSRSRVVILQHPSEREHALNTARLAALGLSRARLLVGESFGSELDELLGEQAYRSVLLFPGEGAQVLGEQGAFTETPLQLLVPDGTWRKARKLLYLNPSLAALPRVCLPPGMPSRYRLRKAPEVGALSTIEAIVQALNLLEGEGRFDALLKPFDALIEGQIAAMGAATYQRNHAD